MPEEIEFIGAPESATQKENASRIKLTPTTFANIMSTYYVSLKNAIKETKEQISEVKDKIRNASTKEEKKELKKELRELRSFCRMTKLTSFLTKRMMMKKKAKAIKLPIDNLEELIKNSKELEGYSDKLAKDAKDIEASAFDKLDVKGLQDTVKNALNDGKEKTGTKTSQIISDQELDKVLNNGKIRRKNNEPINLSGQTIENQPLGLPDFSMGKEQQKEEEKPLVKPNINDYYDEYTGIIDQTAYNRDMREFLQKTAEKSKPQRDQFIEENGYYGADYTGESVNEAAYRKALKQHEEDLNAKLDKYINKKSTADPYESYYDGAFDEYKDGPKTAAKQVAPKIEPVINMPGPTVEELPDFSKDEKETSEKAVTPQKEIIDVDFKEIDDEPVRYENKPVESVNRNTSTNEKMTMKDFAEANGYDIHDRENTAKLAKDYAEYARENPIDFQKQYEEAKNQYDNERAIYEENRAALAEANEQLKASERAKEVAKNRIYITKLREIRNETEKFRNMNQRVSEEIDSKKQATRSNQSFIERLENEPDLIDEISTTKSAGGRAK